MSLVSVEVVAEEESEECFSSLAHPAREASAKAATQEKIKVERRSDSFVIFVNVTIRQESTPPMGSIPHNARAAFSCKPQTVKSGSKKKPSKLGKFISRTYAVYFPAGHGHYGTDADHVPVIPGNDFTPDSSTVAESSLQPIASSNTDVGPAPTGE